MVYACDSSAVSESAAGSAGDGSVAYGQADGAPAACPLPLAHDRFSEAHWQLHQMLDNYHFPMEFRYSTNAFLSSLKSVLTMVRLDLERLGKNKWRAERFERLKDDRILSAFSKGRDVVIHRGSLVQSSDVHMAYFKYGRVKLAIQQNLKTDEPSRSILERLQRLNSEGGGFFVAPGHPWIGEQLGVRREYREPTLSDDLDIVTAGDAALSSVASVLRDAHELLGHSFDHDEDEARSAHDVHRVWDLLETDVDPTVVSKWGWE